MGGPDLRLERTRRFSVVCRADRVAVSIPRLRLSEVSGPSFRDLLRRHGFVVVGHLDGALLDVIEHCTAELKRFFLSATDEYKEGTKGPVYANERGVPMWFVGYERQSMRECLRCAAAGIDGVSWGSDSVGLRSAYAGLAARLQRLCDEALEGLLRSEAPGSVHAARLEDPGEDFSVCYALHYPNEGSAEDVHVGEHRDPSLLVAEPVPEVAGLEIFDEATAEWVAVEDACAPGLEIVIFAGKALAASAGLPALRHRVVADARGRNRFCFIFEQKYAAWYRRGAGYA